MEITIRTAYNIGQNVYAMEGNVICRYRVECIKFNYHSAIASSEPLQIKWSDEISYTIRRINGTAFFIEEKDALDRFFTSIDDLLEYINEQANSFDELL